MNPAMINSTNSVSTTKRKREAERSVNWTVEETQVLLCAWSDERVQKSLAENLRNRHVFKHLSTRMSEMGFCRSPHQCRLRVKTLKANYVRAQLHRSVNGAQPCTFKYFAEMDAVLGPRSTGGVGGGSFFAPLEQTAELGLDGTGSIPEDLNSNTDEISGHHFGSSGRTGRQRPLSASEGRGGRSPWQLDSDVKLEEREDSTDEFEFVDAGFPACPRVYLESGFHREMSGTPVDNSLSSPSPHVVPPPPSPPLPQSAASPLPAPPDPSPDNALPTSGLLHHLESPRPEPVLKHLLGSFQRLVSDTRGLLAQLESQRQEQARWHQELLSQWLQREERRQREAADREERREKARMEHEIRVLELLTGLAREHGCKGGGGQTLLEGPTGPSHNTDKERK